MAVENVQVNTSTGIDGSSYTSSISNDQLTNADFLKLMIEELKMQDSNKTNGFSTDAINTNANVYNQYKSRNN